MSETTKNLKLFKYNTTSDANVPFSIDNALNANWDILDENWSKGAGVLPGFLYKVTGLIDESENIFRYANGQVITEDNSVSGLSTFLDKQEKLGADIFCTELEWQNIKTTSKLGQVGKYVRDKKAGTVRLPLILNEQGLTDLANCGVIKDESLPNIQGRVNGYIIGNYATNSGTAVTFTGALKGVSTYSGTISGGNNHFQAINNLSLDASETSSTYQDNAPVQQEAVQYPYVICVNTGVEEAEKPINNYQVNNVYSFGMSQYYKGTMNNVSWLKSEGQWNAGTVYTDLYTWMQTQITNKVDGFKNSSATDITDYDFVINTTDQTFRLPLKNGMEGVFASGVKGNGLTLGITDGTHNAGCGVFLNNGICPTSQYGSQVAVSGAIMTDISEFPANTKVGITPDVSKSGMVVDTTVPEGYNLYYYVGDTLQNVDIINVARIEEKLTDKTDRVQAASATIPNYTNRNTGITAFNVWKTVTVDSWVSVCSQTNAPSRTLWILIADENGDALDGCTDNNAFMRAQQGNANCMNQVFAFVPKNYSYKVIIDSNQTLYSAHEYPLKGVN